MNQRNVLIILAIVTLLSTSCFAGNVVIHRDTYGVPHIYADDVEGLYYGFGYSVAQDRLFQIEMLKRMYKGQVSELYGEDYVALDLYWLREYPTKDELQQQYEALAPKYQKIISFYAKGINAWIEKAIADPDEKLPMEFHMLDFLPEKWEPTDVGAVYLASLGFFMDLSAELPNADMYTYLLDKYGDKAQKYFDDVVWGFDPSSYPTIYTEQGSANHVKKEKNQLAQLDIRGLMDAALNFNAQEELNGKLIQLNGYQLPEKIKMKASRAASYAMVVGPEKSKTGNPLLMGGPQFDHRLPSMVHEVSLHGAGFNVTGSTLIGSPFLMFGYTDSTAFTSTAGGDNVLDYYEEKINPENPTQYYFKGEWVEMEVRKELLQIKGQEPKEVTLYRTVHGPVASMIDTDDDGKVDVAYSKKLSCFDTYLSGIPSWTDVMLANNPNQFKKAAQKLTLSINHFYADNKGNIGFYHSGKYPIRSEAAEFDLRLPTPGTGEFEWIGFVDPKDNPHVINPANDLLINWNNKPDIAWGNGDLGSIFLWAGWSEDHRVLRIVDIVNSKDKLGAEDIEEIIHAIADSDHRAFAMKKYLLEALATSDNSEMKQVKEIMEGWNNLRRDANEDGYYDNPALTIFSTWWAEVNQQVFEDDLGSFWETLLDNYAGYSFFVRAIEGEKATIPVNRDYFNGKDWHTVFVATMQDAVATLKTERGTDDMTQWLTEVKKMSFLPLHLGGVPQSESEVPQINYMDRGTENHIVEVMKPQPQGKNVCPPGQSGFVSKEGVKSPHFADQLSLFANWTYKDILFTKGDILYNSESTEILTY